MRKTIGNLALAGFDDIFSISKPGAEHIMQIPLTELFAPEFHPFNVRDDDAMTRLAENIKHNGVLEPGLARPRAEGGYELLCGNRRKRACELAGLSTMPVIVRDLDDDSAALVMVDSNLERREKILPSERAWAYRVMMEALNHSGIKGESHSHKILTERTGVTKSQLFRIIRLTELIAPLADAVDANRLAFNPAVELSYLSQREQTAVHEAMVSYDIKPSLSQAIRLKKLKQSGALTLALIDSILSETKKPPKGEPTGSVRFRRFFPPEYTQAQIDSVIVSLLREWKATL